MRRLVAALALLLSLAACGVTESGNPCPGGDCTAGTPAFESGGVYENPTFGVRIAYPGGWSATEGADGTTVLLSSPDDPPTSALFSFERLDPVPSSLLDYLEGLYPDRQFHEFSTATLTGLCFNDPAPGPNGGDAAEHFFLGGDVLVHVVDEIFLDGQEAFLQVLNGVSFF